MPAPADTESMRQPETRTERSPPNAAIAWRYGVRATAHLGLLRSELAAADALHDHGARSTGGHCGPCGDAAEVRGNRHGSDGGTLGGTVARQVASPAAAPARKRSPGFGRGGCPLPAGRPARSEPHGVVDGVCVRGREPRVGGPVGLVSVRRAGCGALPGSAHGADVLEGRLPHVWRVARGAGPLVRRILRRRTTGIRRHGRCDRASVRGWRCWSATGVSVTSP